MWAKFAKIDGEWKYCGMTPHEELVVEFEENVQIEHGSRTPVRVINLED